MTGMHTEAERHRSGLRWAAARSLKKERGRKLEQQEALRAGVWSPWGRPSCACSPAAPITCISLARQAGESQRDLHEEACSKRARGHRYSAVT